MAKSPRSAAKQESDKVYNQRRRAKRALEKLMRDTGGSLTAAQRGYKASLEQQIAATYIGHRPDRARRESAIRAADLLGHVDLLDDCSCSITGLAVKYQDVQ